MMTENAKVQGQYQWSPQDLVESLEHLNSAFTATIPEIAIFKRQHDPGSHRYISESQLALKKKINVQMVSVSKSKVKT